VQRERERRAQACLGELDLGHAADVVPHLPLDELRSEATTLGDL
jgi:hypothetical protein